MNKEKIQAEIHGRNFRNLKPMKSFRKAKVETSTIRDVNEIDGIEFIPSEVKSRIENLIADTIKWIKKPLVKPAVIINKSVLTGH